jgi:hypothetical protein
LLIRLYAATSLERLGLLPPGTVAALLGSPASPDQRDACGLAAGLDAQLGDWGLAAPGNGLSLPTVGRAAGQLGQALATAGQVGAGLFAHTYEACCLQGRRSAGAYYTDARVARYAVSRCLEAAAAESAAGPRRIVDPACGSGAFLVAALAALQGAAHHPARPPLTDLSRLYGLDRDPDAAAVCRLELLLQWARAWPAAQGAAAWRLVVERVRPLLHAQVQVGDALLGPWSAGPDAATLPERLPGLGEYDLVLGNPPYLGEEDHGALFRRVAETPLFAPWYEGRMDLSGFFVHLGLSLLRTGGRLALLLPAYFPTAAGTRRRLLPRLVRETTLEEIVDFGEQRLFAATAPGHHNLLLRLRRGEAPGTSGLVRRLGPDAPPDALDRLLAGARGAWVSEHPLPPRPLLLDPAGALRLAPPQGEALCQRILAAGRPLRELLRVSQGIVPGPANLGRKAVAKLLAAEDDAAPEPSAARIAAWCRQRGLRLGQGVFVLTATEVAALQLTAAEWELLRPFHHAAELRPGEPLGPARSWLLYLTRETCPTLAEYPNVSRHLQRFPELLARRRETAQGTRAWYHLHWPREEALFVGDKLLAPRQTPDPTFVHAPRPAFVDLGANVLTPRQAGLPLAALALILGSTVARTWFYHQGKRKGRVLQLDGEPLAAFPLRLPACPAPFLELAARLAASPADRVALLHTADRLTAELYGLADVPAAVLAHPERAGGEERLPEQEPAPDAPPTG